MDHVREAWQAIADLFLGEHLHDRVAETCGAIGLPHPGALKTLLLLEEGDPPPMRALADRLPCDASYMTQLVDVLEELGYVERRPSPTDRRVKLVQITDKGLAARAQAREVMATPPDIMRDALTSADARTLARIMAKVVQSRPQRAGP